MPTDPMQNFDRKSLIKLLKGVLATDPSFASGILTVTSDALAQYEATIEARRNREAMLVIEFLIACMHPQRNTAGFRRMQWFTLSIAFRYYAPDGLIDGHSEAVKRSWEYLKKLEKEFGVWKDPQHIPQPSGGVDGKTGETDA